MASNNQKYFDILKRQKSFEYAALAIIGLGILLRLVVYVQCNSMYVDEANVARNVFERSYTGLIQPLNYYQYAPPLFLWIVKFCTSVFGYSEYGYRIFPLICSFLSLALMYTVLKYYSGYKGICYALLLLALGPLYVRYAATTKQYIPDMMVALFLLWLALSNTMENRTPFKLFLLWSIAGSIAVWSSMPSVFILTGVGVYYFYTVIKSGQPGKLWFLAAAGIIWLAQFAFYYLIILRPQANGNVIQNFHKDYFFYWPANIEMLKEDISLLGSLVATAGGHQALSLILHIGCIIVGLVYVGRNQMAKLLLVVVPILALLFAAALHQYTLIPRVTLVAMPLILTLIAVGLEQILSTSYTLLHAAALVCALICIINFNTLPNFIYPMQEEEMKQSLNYLKKANINGTQIYIEDLAVAAYTYYTEIHPNKEQWSMLPGGRKIDPNANLDSLSATFPKRIAILYGWDRSFNDQIHAAVAKNSYILTDSNIVKGGSVFIYRK